MKDRKRKNPSKYYGMGKCPCCMYSVRLLQNGALGSHKRKEEIYSCNGSWGGYPIKNKEPKTAGELANELFPVKEEHAKRQVFGGYAQIGNTQTW